MKFVHSGGTGESANAPRLLHHARHGPAPRTRNMVAAAAVPVEVKESISAMRQAVQAALLNRCSRMTVEMPSATLYGVEKGGKKGDNDRSNR